MSTAVGPAEGQAWLIGGAGKDFVEDTLSKEGPGTGFKKIAKLCNLSNPLCAPLMGMVDQLGFSRLEAHKAVLQASKAALLARISELGSRTGTDKDKENKVRLERLLGSSFIYLGMPELRDVPLSVMDQLEKVPANWLKQLAQDKQIFKDLPARVQRQVWEFDKNLLQSDALPLVGQYKYETATYMRALAADEFMPAVLSKSASRKPNATDGLGTSHSSDLTRPLGITRKILRKGSTITQAVKEMVGSSQKIYNLVVELCTVKFRDTSDLYVGIRDCSYCTLRSQLLMALHDDNNPIAAKDKCHTLAWTLDAGIQKGHLTEKHLEKLHEYFDELCSAEAAQAPRSRGSRIRGVPQDEAESAGNISGSLVEPFKVVGDAGLILRDPSAMHLLAAQVLSLLVEVVAGRIMPSDEPNISFLLRLMQLAVDCRQMLRDRKYRFPEPDRAVLCDLLPLLAGLMVDYEMGGSPEPNSLLADVELTWPDSSATRQRVCAALQRNEVARRVAQAFVLERLARGDFQSAAKMLRLLVQHMAPASIPEVADFAATLAQRLADLVKAKRLAPASKLWNYAVDNLLVAAVDAHTQTHEEVLRLLLEAATPAPSRPALLRPSEVGEYLALTLEASKKSRKRYKKHNAEDALAGFPMLLANSDIGSDIGSDGWPGIRQLKVKGADGIKSVYEMFNKRVPGLTPAIAPQLFSYLQET